MSNVSNCYERLNIYDRGKGFVDKHSEKDNVHWIVETPKSRSL